MAENWWRLVAALSVVAAVLGACGASGVKNSEWSAPMSSVVTPTTCQSPGTYYVPNTPAGASISAKEKFNSVSVGWDPDHRSIDVSVVTPAASILTGPIPASTDESAVQAYDKAGLPVALGNGPIAYLADSGGGNVYQLSINFPGAATLTPPGSTQAVYLPAYSTGRQVEVQIPKSDVPQLGQSFLWQFSEVDGNQEQVCPPNDDQMSYGDLLANSQASNPGDQPSGDMALSSKVTGDFGTYPPSSGSPTTASTATTSTTTAAIPPPTTATCKGLVTVTVGQATVANGMGSLNGTVTNGTNVPLNLYEVALNAIYPPGYTDYNGLAEAGVDSQTGVISPGQEETWSLNDPLGPDGTPVPLTVTPLGFIPQANGATIPLNAPCAAQDSSSP